MVQFGLKLSHLMSIGGKIHMIRHMNGIFDRQVGGRSDTHLMTSGLYCYNCYATSTIVITIVRYASICSVPYYSNYYDASKSKAKLLEA